MKQRRLFLTRHLGWTASLKPSKSASKGLIPGQCVSLRLWSVAHCLACRCTIYLGCSGRAITCWLLASALLPEPLLLTIGLLLLVDQRCTSFTITIAFDLKGFFAEKSTVSSFDSGFFPSSSVSVVQSV